MSKSRCILILAYGNPGRRDDGLGPALAAALEGLDLPGVTIDSDYQLTVEHAADVAQHDAVIFADAACTGPEPFSFARIDEVADAALGPCATGVANPASSAGGPTVDGICPSDARRQSNIQNPKSKIDCGRRPCCASRPSSTVGFSTHSVSPAAVLALAGDLFGRAPAAYLLGIRGYEFNGFGEGLSPRAQANLAAALDSLRPALRARRFDGLVRLRSAVTRPDAARSPAAVAPCQEAPA